MSGRSIRELPEDKRRARDRAVKLSWITILFFATAVTLVYLALGSSQAMKAAWVEDMLAFVPPAAFLIADRIRFRSPDETYPYGYHRSISIAYVIAATALLLLGLLILEDSISKLIAFEHPPIGLVQPFGQQIWLGWIMIAVLTYTMVPAVILGRLKVPLARELHDKVLFADAKMNKADWMTAGAAILGILGIRFGLWWADPIAAIIISADIVRDGITNIRAGMATLMDKRPQRVDGENTDPLPTRLESAVKDLDWVSDARVRLREQGHVFFGDIVVVPRDERDLVARIEAATKELMRLDWRLYDLQISPRSSLEEPQETAARDLETGD